MHKNILLAVGITILFLGMSITSSMTVDTVKKPSVPISNGKTLYVGGTGEGNYTTIQDAIDNASEGDTVFVYAYSSPYYENVAIKKSINLSNIPLNTKFPSRMISYLRKDFCLLMKVAESLEQTTPC